MVAVAVHGAPMGVPRLLKKIKKHFPDLKHGYFNPALRP
jgi:hypothetical protein